MDKRAIRRTERYTGIPSDDNTFAEGNFICGSAATSLGVSPLHLCVAQPRSFVSACSGMMLTFSQMMLRASTQTMLCPADTNEKIQVEGLGFFGRGTKTRTQDTWFWRPLLYQLSYTPVERIYYTTSVLELQYLFSKKSVFLQIF